MTMAAPPVGLALGLALWLVAGRGGFSDQADSLQARLDALRVGGQGQARVGGEGLTEAIARPLFALTTGPGAVAEAVLKLEGVARSPGRSAALISINGAAALWLAQGQTRDGVTLQEVAASRVVIDTPIGLREVKLGERTVPDGAGTNAAMLEGQSEMPPGYRGPPPPASAPGMGG